MGLPSYEYTDQVANVKIHPLHKAVHQNAKIVKHCEGVEVKDGTCYVYFTVPLSTMEKAELDTMYSDHVGG